MTPQLNKYVILSTEYHGVKVTLQYNFSLGRIFYLLEGRNYDGYRWTNETTDLTSGIELYFWYLKDLEEKHSNDRAPWGEKEYCSECERDKVDCDCGSKCCDIE